MDLLISAFRANAFRVTKPAGFAKHDALGSTFLRGGHHVMIAVGQIKHLEGFTDQIFGHGSALHIKRTLNTMVTSDAKGDV